MHFKPTKKKVIGSTIIGMPVWIIFGTGRMCQWSNPASCSGSTLLQSLLIAIVSFGIPYCIISLFQKVPKVEK